MLKSEALNVLESIFYKNEPATLGFNWHTHWISN